MGLDHLKKTRPTVDDPGGDPSHRGSEGSIGAGPRPRCNRVGRSSVSDTWQGPGYWLASDGKWYSPDLHPDASAPMGSPAEGMINASRIETPMSAAPWDSAGSTPRPSSTESSWGTSRTATLPRAGAELRDRRVRSRSGTAGPRPRVNRRARRWGAGVVVTMIVAAGVLVTPSGQSPKWDPRVLGIVHFDEQHRGLTFKTPVKVEFLNNAQFNKEVSVPDPTSKADRTAESHALGELRALGLVHGNPQPRAPARTN